VVKEELKESNESINERLLFRFREINSGNPWYGRNLESLLEETVNDERVLEILAHMVAWRRIVIDVLQGGRPKIEMNSTDDWPDAHNLSLEQVKIDFETTRDQLIEAIRIFPEDQWFNLLWHGEHHYYKLVNGLIDHDLYHMGQVTVLSKMKKTKT